MTDFFSMNSFVHTKEQKIIKALMGLVPKCACMCGGGDAATYADIIWQTEDIPCPTWEEIEARIALDDAAWIAGKDERTAYDVRYQRDWYLRSYVDEVVSNPLRWTELTSDQQAEWASYRRDLLDITAQSGFPQDVTWPTKPE
jgi:hypothetical protein